MAISLAKDTSQALGERAGNCKSRSLLFDRFADPQAKEKVRLELLRSFTERAPELIKARNWSSILLRDLVKYGGSVLYVQLNSRLMLNMSGGVMENAGLCLDRFGLPFLPGSALKGCARRTVVHALREWCLAGGSTDVKPTEVDNLLTPVCAPFASPLKLLEAAAKVFGWSDSEWGPTSDWAWACGAHLWPVISAQLQANFAGKDFDSRSGVISFLPGYPVDLGESQTVEGLEVKVPQLGQLDLDIVTCHHRDYYTGSREVATDDEEPNPVVFPAVAAGHVFGLGLVPIRTGGSEELNWSRKWLATGLSTFGLGAKTNAGYGWFATTEAGHGAVEKTLQNIQKAREEEQKRARELESQRLAEVEKRRKAEEFQTATANLNPEQIEDYKLSPSQMNDDQFRGRFESFVQRDESEQRAIVRALRKAPEETGSRRKYWDELKKKESKGGKLAKLAQAIRDLSKKMHPSADGKEGKMP